MEAAVSDDGRDSSAPMWGLPQRWLKPNLGPQLPTNVSEKKKRKSGRCEYSTREVAWGGGVIVGMC